MKTGAITFRLVLSFLLVAIAASGVSGANEAVLDIKGNQVKANASYDIRFEKGTSKSWVTRRIVADSFDDIFGCPDRIIMYFNNILSIPTTTIFLPAVTDTVVRVSTKLNIKFKTQTLCRSSGVWKVANVTKTVQEVALTGSLLSNKSMFTIKKLTNTTYKFVSSNNSMEIDVVPIVNGRYKLGFAKNSSYVVTFHPTSRLL